MRICYLADGRYLHTHRWMRFFAERGHSTHLISFASLTPENLASVRATGAVYHGIHENLHLKRFWLTVSSLRFVKRVLREQKIDLLHCHFLGTNAWYGALSSFHPLVVTVMGGDILGEDWRPGNDIRERWLTPYALRKADLITCWSQKLVKVVRRYSRPATPVEVIHGGVDLGRFQPGPKSEQLRQRLNIPADANIVLSPRLMRPLYNLEQIARAAIEVCATNPRTYFLFAYPPVSTDGAYEEGVRAVIKDGRLSDRVRLLGEIPYDEMADYYRLADVVVSVPYSDGTPMSVLESMACGTPVVVSDIENYDRSYIERDRTALFAEPQDAQSIAGAIVRLLHEPTLANILASEGRRRVEAMGSYEAQMSRMESLYFSVVKNSELKL